MNNKIKIFLSVCIASTFCMVGCDEDTSVPVMVSDIVFSHNSIQDTDSVVTVAAVNRPLTLRVDTNADLCTWWPAGDRLTLKSKIDPAQDSIDVFGNVVLVRSDNFEDYGLLLARGKVMSGSNQKGYTFTYTYKTPGTYNIVIVATRHGHSSPDYENSIIERTLVVE